jgi:hypothetical protein
MPPPRVQPAAPSPRAHRVRARAKDPTDEGDTEDSRLNPMFPNGGRGKSDAAHAPQDGPGTRPSGRSALERRLSSRMDAVRPLQSEKCSFRLPP